MKISTVACVAWFAGSALAGDVKLLKQPAAFPLVISASGSYRLKSDIVVPDANTTAISITADDVTLDLNGYAIKGPSVCSGSPATCAPTGTGVGISSATDDVTIENGTVRGMGSHGIEISGAGTVVHRMRVRGNAGRGIDIAHASRVTDSIVLENGSSGVLIGTSSVVTGNVIRANGNDAIGANGAPVITGNSVYANGGGISLAGGSSGGVVSGNVVSGNGGSVFGSGTAIGNMVADNADNGFTWDAGVVISNTVLSNLSEGVIGSALVTANYIVDNGDPGIAVDAESGYSNNTLDFNNGGDGNPQVSGGIEIGGNVCGGDTSCP